MTVSTRRFSPGLPLALAVGLMTFPSAVARAAAETPGSPVATYRYPEQPGLGTLEKADAGHALLTDGRDAPAVWGAWDVKPFVVDWTFARPVRVKAIHVTIEHPVDPNSDGTHPRLVQLFVGGPDAKFASEPDVTLPIPFERGPRQKVTLQLPGDGLVAKHLRTHFEGSNRQIVLGEVSFVTEPATDEQLKAAFQAARAAQAVPSKPVDVLPAGRLADVSPPPADSIFGASGHMLHSDHFYPGHFSPYWRLEYTLPFVQRLGIGSVREPIYQDYFVGTDPKGEAARQANRKLVEDYIAAYDAAGVRVVLCAIVSGSGEGTKPGGDTLEAYCRWLADMAKRHKCVEGVEIGNEPNLTPFWKHSYMEYVESARTMAKMLREAKPDIRIIVGSFSGMGGVWMRPDLLKEAGSQEKEQAIHWARKCFEAGLLDFADGVSTHPYNESSTEPEGGIFLESRKDPNGYEKELKDFWDLIQKYNTSGRQIKLYFTELGYELTAGRDPQWQADYLSRLMLILFDTRISGSIPLEQACWYDLKQDDAIVGASGWGLVSLNTTHVRPAFVAYQRIAHEFGNTGDYQVLDAEATFGSQPDVVKHYVWRRKSDGAIVVPFWRMDQLQKRPADFDSELTLSLPASVKPSRVEVVDLHDDQPLPLGFKVVDGKLHTAVHVTDRAAWLVVHPSR